MWPSELMVQILYRANSQVFCKFESKLGRYLNFDPPTLREEGTIFEIHGEDILMNGEYVSIGTELENGDVRFTTSSEPDIIWDGTRLFSKKCKKALDIYSYDSHNVKLWHKNNNNNQKWNKQIIDLEENHIELILQDNTNTPSVFFPIAEPTTVHYYGKELVIDNYIFFSGETLLHNHQPKVRMPALLMTESTFRQIILDSSMTHEGAFGNDYKRYTLAQIIKKQIGGTFDISLSESNWVTVWKFPSDMFEIGHPTSIWTREIRSEFALPVGFYPLIQDFGPDVSTNNRMPLGDSVFKMRQRINSVDVHTLKNVVGISIPMISFNYFFHKIWEYPSNDEEKRVNIVCNELKKRGIHVFPCHSEHHAAVVFYTYNSKLITCEMLSSWLLDDTFVTILESGLLHNKKSKFRKWVNVWKQMFDAAPTEASSSTSAPVATDSESISILTYNCLYTEFANDTSSVSGFETELIHKTVKYKAGKVKMSNLGWNVRLPKIINNIVKNKIPDILLLQETTPLMCSDILEHLPGYDAVHSKNGNLGGVVSDGYCYVLFNKSNFQLKKVVETQNLRFVGVVLTQNVTGKEFFIASTHLPRSGTAPTSFISKTISKMSIPIIIGGDFNVTYNPFHLENLTGEEATFYNDDTYKLDWIVGKNVQSINYHVNPIVAKEGRWPNEFEGSDHTAVFVKVMLS
tara:strand:+ start:2351 stop:4411 length:2061 start_codon:yes stop_codon:yes gene_type:complete